ncbi:hypothetical protein NUBL9656_49770 [Klebsiella pneumoniae]|nr:hypothetical protein NUBL9656_49770 [Klebsiella pneumoniae]
MPVHDPSSESFDWETIFESSDRCGETVARTCLFGQRRTSQVSYYYMCLANVEMSCSKQVRDDVWESLENSFFSLSQAWRMVADARLSQ